MQQQAPLDYVREYYDSNCKNALRFPDEAAGNIGFLAKVDGNAVLNVGCGPQFFDNAKCFKAIPQLYVGVDINAATIEFLESDLNPLLVTNRRMVLAALPQIELYAADVFDCANRFNGRFDWIVGRGMFAPFYGNRLPEMLAIMRDALKPGGRLLKTTWHGPRRSPEQTADRLRYGYDSAAEPTPDDLIDVFAAAGLTTVIDDRRLCNPETYGWQQVQNCIFEITN
jgi:SAM-dependent methyltransferase